MREHKTRHSIGQRRLTNSRRTPNQPGMRNATASIGIQQCHLRMVMPEQRCGLARVNGGYARLYLAGAHAELATLPGLATKKRSRNAVHIFSATRAGSAVASISTHRCGSSAAILR